MMQPPWRWLPFVFAAVALAFVSATVFTQYRTNAIDHAASDIAVNASPSIEALSTARSEARDVFVQIREQLFVFPSTDQGAERARRAAAQRLDHALADYFRQRTFSGEEDLWHRIRVARSRLDQTIGRFEHMLELGDIVGARTLLVGQLTEEFTELSDSLGAAIELNARRSGDLALQIQRERATSARLALALDIVCVVMTVLATFLLLRGMRSHAALLERHRRIEEERAVELEQFAGRIAHDILSPIGTVSMALEMVDRIDDPTQQKRALRRGQSSITRVKRLVEGLLGFARAGARPEPGARCDLAAVLADVVEENRSSAEVAGLNLTLSTDDSEVACSAGVLMSLTANLVRNAIKYGRRPGDESDPNSLGPTADESGPNALAPINGEPRGAIEVRGRAQNGAVYVEVIDHGPGLGADIVEQAFEPFRRGTNATGASIGLGLATVKKLAESHGGQAGLRPTPGGGCTFWFALPTTPSGEALSDPPPDHSSPSASAN